MINQHVHIYKCVQSHIIVLQQNVSANPVTNIRVWYSKNTINTQILYKNMWWNSLIFP